MPEDLQLQRQPTQKDRLRAQLSTKDSFVDDFSLSRIRRSLSTTMREGKAVKEEALKKASTGKKDRDAKTAKDAKRLLWGFVGEQWGWLALGAPFMFLGSTIDFLAPNYIG